MLLHFWPLFTWCNTNCYSFNNSSCVSLLSKHLTMKQVGLFLDSCKAYTVLIYSLFIILKIAKFSNQFGTHAWTFRKVFKLICIPTKVTPHQFWINFWKCKLGENVVIWHMVCFIIWPFTGFLHDMEKLGEQIDISKLSGRHNSMVSTVACHWGGPGPNPGKVREWLILNKNELIFHISCHTCSMIL